MNDDSNPGQAEKIFQLEKKI